jgi:hypothetical protein
VLRRHVNLPPINAGDEVPTEYFDINDPLSLLFEFTNSGLPEFDLDSINPDINPKSFRVTLSRELEAPAPFETEELEDPIYISPKRIFRDASGNTVINFTITPDIALDTEGVQIEYWDGEGDWKVATPVFFETRGNEFFWIDNGQPKTDTASGEVPFRLYRIRGRPAP